MTKEIIFSFYLKSLSLNNESKQVFHGSKNQFYVEQDKAQTWQVHGNILNFIIIKICSLSYYLNISTLKCKVWKMKLYKYHFYQVWSYFQEKHTLIKRTLIFTNTTNCIFIFIFSSSFLCQQLSIAYFTLCWSCILFIPFRNVRRHILDA